LTGSSDEDGDGEGESDRAPICGACGVTALVADAVDGQFICENPDCEAYGDPV
jgi:hypothetical protein